MLIAGSSRLDYSSPQKLLIETHIDHMNRFLRQIRFLELILRARCFWYTYLARVIFESWISYVKAFLMLNAILVFSFLMLTHILFASKKYISLQSLTVVSTIQNLKFYYHFMTIFTIVRLWALHLPKDILEWLRLCTNLSFSYNEVKLCKKPTGIMFFMPNFVPLYKVNTVG